MADSLLSTSCILVASIIFSIALSGAVFWPIQSVAVARPTISPKFGLSELFVLMAQVQIVLAICFLAYNRQNAIELGSSALFWCTLVAVWWWQGLKMLTRAQVKDGNLRIFFVAVFCPIGFLVSLSLILFPFWFLGAFVTLTVSLSMKEYHFLIYFGICLVCGAIHSLIIFGANKGCNYFVPDDPARERRFVS